MTETEFGLGSLYSNSMCTYIGSDRTLAPTFVFCLALSNFPSYRMIFCSLSMGVHDSFFPVPNRKNTQHLECGIKEIPGSDRRIKAIIFYTVASNQIILPCNKQHSGHVMNAERMEGKGRFRKGSFLGASANLFSSLICCGNSNSNRLLAPG